MKRKIFIVLICYSLIGLFIYAAISKLIDFQTFRAELRESSILGEFSWLLSWGVPLIELLTALTLFIPVFRLFGLYVSVILMSSFTIYLTILSRSTGPISCDCGGLLAQMDISTHWWFNLGFLLLGLVGILLYKSKAIPN